jgi:hypothetical protein
MTKPGDVVFALMGADSGDGGEWLINVYADEASAELCAVELRRLRPARMTETTTAYRVQAMVLL